MKKAPHLKQKSLQLQILIKMLTLQQFIDKWNGKFCEVGGSSAAINQCVDLANAYINEVWGMPMIFGTNAQDFPLKAGDKYDYIKNTATNKPNAGDVLIYKSPNGIGHIGVVVEATVDKITKFFDQNWPLKSVCNISEMAYIIGDYKVDGWLRCKTPVNNSNDENMLTDTEKNILNFIRTATVTVNGISRNVNEGDLRQGIGYITDNIDKTVKDLQTQVNTLNDKIGIINGKLTVEGKTALEWQKEYVTANEKLTKALSDLLQANNKPPQIVEKEVIKTVTKIVDTLKTASVSKLLKEIVNRLSNKK